MHTMVFLEQPEAVTRSYRSAVREEQAERTRRVQHHDCAVAAMIPKSSESSDHHCGSDDRWSFICLMAAVLLTATVL